MSEQLRFDNFKVTKAHIEARRYRVVVLDMSRTVGDRQVWWAKEEGWTRANRDAARTWIEREQALSGLPARIELEDAGIEIPDAVVMNGGGVRVFRNRGLIDLVLIDEDGLETDGVTVNIDDLLDALKRLEAL